MVDMMIKHNSISERLSIAALLAVIAALPFSYHPLIAFGSASGMHLDGSLLYVLVALAVIVSLPLLWKRRTELLQNRALQFLIGFAALCAVSIIWSDNPFRGSVAAAFLLLLIGLVCVVAVNLPLLSQHRRLAYRLVLASTGLSIAWSLWQVYGDALGLSGSVTLLPATYQSAVFGVARPTGFALEPQFFGSFLLIPFFWSVWRYLHGDNRKNYLLLLGTVAVGAVLLLTLSRGAIYAAAVGLVLLALLHHSSPKRWLHVTGSLIGALVISGCIIVSAATINQRDSTNGYRSLSAAINHLSLGVIALPIDTSNAAQAETKPEEFSGYVTASTDSRLSMSSQALSLWTASPQHLFFGIGNGSFGTTLHAKDSHYPEGSIVNNYYLELLVETGFAGISLFLAFIGTLVYGLLRARHILPAVVLASLLVQACFFSGNANVIHLWIVVGLGLGLLLLSTKKLLI